MLQLLLAMKKKNATTPNVGAAITTSTLSAHSDVAAAGFGGPTPFNKYGLGSPPKGPESVSLEKALENIKKDGFRKLLKKPGEVDDTTRMLVFLYGRGYLRGRRNKDKRIKEINELIEGDASKRLLQIVEADGDKDLFRDATFFASSVDSCVTLQRYFSQPNSFGFLNDMSKAKYYFRIQRAGNCYLMAPCVMTAYLAQKRGGAEHENCPPVDVSKLVRHSFSDEELYKYVVGDEGGNALHILNKLVHGDPTKIYSIPAECVRAMEPGILCGLLKTFGPALVSNFGVNENFEVITSATSAMKEKEVTSAVKEKEVTTSAAKEKVVTTSATSSTKEKEVTTSATSEMKEKDVTTSVVKEKEVTPGATSSMKEKEVTTCTTSAMKEKEVTTSATSSTKKREYYIIQFDGKKTAQGKLVKLKGPEGEVALQKERDDMEASLRDRRAAPEGSNIDLTTPRRGGEESIPDLPTPRILNPAESAETAESGSTFDSLTEGKKTKQLGLHAMVLIGGRQEKNKKWLLFQNWWEDMQLVEVSDTYFNDVGGVLQFLTKRALEHVDFFESAYSTNTSPIAECNNLDMHDNMGGCLDHGIGPRERAAF